MHLPLPYFLVASPPKSGQCPEDVPLPKVDAVPWGLTERTLLMTNYVGVETTILILKEACHDRGTVLQ